jgi:hypothetical protein
MPGQIPQPEWFDLDDELNRIAMEGACSPTLYFHSRLSDHLLLIAGLIHNNENWSWPSGPSNPSRSHSLGKYLPLFVERIHSLSPFFTNTTGNLR